MSPRTILASTIAAAALAVIATPAAAQQSRTAQAPRVVARYDFGVARRAITLPSTITVADSAGTLVASARVAGAREPIPMLVHVIESDLVLEAATPDGILTVVLDKQADGAVTSAAAGRWALGKLEGNLRTRARI